jgi:transposase
MLPSMNLRRDVCHHDNDRPHTAPATVVFLANQNVTVLRRPFKSLDFNPIEHFVDDLDRRVRSRQPATQTLQELQQALEQ